VGNQDASGITELVPVRFAAALRVAMRVRAFGARVGVTRVCVCMYVCVRVCFCVCVRARDTCMI
jgi:hypothetical protein